MYLTEEKIKEALEGKLCIGKRVTIQNYKKEKGKEFTLKETRKGVINGLYKHIFTVEINGQTEGFRYAQFFVKGDEREVL